MSGSGDQVLLVSNGITNERLQTGHATNWPARSRSRASVAEQLVGTVLLSPEPSALLLLGPAPMSEFAASSPDRRHDRWPARRPPQIQGP
jgi:hypothetical protein